MQTVDYTNQALTNIDYLCVLAKKMKKCISIIVTLVFLIDIGGYYLWFCISQNSIRQTVSEEIAVGIPPENLTLVIVPVHDESGIEWVKSNKEFRYKGEMFDVVRVTVQNQQKHYYCLKDQKEKQLITNFNKNNSSRKESGKKIKVFEYKYSPEYIVLIKKINSGNLKITAVPDLYQSSIVDINSPPPEFS